MLQIRLKSVAPTEGSPGAKHVPAETVTVACPDHLVLADLPVAKGIGAATAASLVKTIGRRSRRQLGERVHFCVRCDFPIAIYGRLSPCEHAFCLDCARSDSICYLCDERIQKIQTIKMMEGIFICAAPHCLKSFLKRSEFESHIHETHAYLLQPNAEKLDGNESEARSKNQVAASESTARAPPRPVFSPGSNSQFHDRDDKPRLQREQSLPRPVMQPTPPPGFGQIQNNPADLSRPPGFDRPVPHSLYHQQSFDSSGASVQESGQFSDKQQGIISESPFSEYPPMHSIQAPNYAVPMNSNQVQMMPSLPFGFPFPVDGSQPFYGAPYQMVRQDSAQDVGQEQGSLLGFPPGSVPNMNFAAGYPQSWNAGQAGVPFEQATPGGQGSADGFPNSSDSQGNVAFYQGGMPFNPQQMTNKAMEQQSQGCNAMDPRDGKGILASQPTSLPPPPPPPQLKRKFYHGDTGRDGQS